MRLPSVSTPTLVSSASLHALAEALSHACGARLQAMPAARVHGGSIHECYRWNSDAGPLFVKITAPERADALHAEAEGLAALAQAHAVRVPRVRALGSTAEHGYLALEWLALTTSSSAAAARLGEQLALQHRVCAERFGWHRDNTIGATAQPNGWCRDWVEFWRERRLGHQLELAYRHGYRDSLERQALRVLEQLGQLFSSHRPQASLLHGDLWGGNWGVERGGAPVLFDPAVYYGDREADLAMTRLFGGFDSTFYAAYASVWPLDAGARARIPLYNLYHVLNHLNLFGGGYLPQARRLLEQLLAELHG